MQPRTVSQTPSDPCSRQTAARRGSPQRRRVPAAPASYVLSPGDPAAPPAPMHWRRALMWDGERSTWSIRPCTELKLAVRDDRGSLSSLPDDAPREIPIRVREMARPHLGGQLPPRPRRPASCTSTAMNEILLCTGGTVRSCRSMQTMVGHASCASSLAWARAAEHDDDGRSGRRVLEDYRARRWLLSWLSRQCDGSLWCSGSSSERRLGHFLPR